MGTPDSCLLIAQAATSFNTPQIVAHRSQHSPNRRIP